MVLSMMLVYVIYANDAWEAAYKVRLEVISEESKLLSPEALFNYM